MHFWKGAQGLKGQALPRPLLPSEGLWGNTGSGLCNGGPRPLVPSTPEPRAACSDPLSSTQREIPLLFLEPSRQPTPNLQSTSHLGVLKTGEGLPVRERGAPPRGAPRERPQPRPSRDF